MKYDYCHCYFIWFWSEQHDDDDHDTFDMQSAYFLQNYTIQDFFMTSQSGTYDRRDRVNDVQEFEQLETGTYGTGTLLFLQKIYAIQFSRPKYPICYSI